MFVDTATVQVKAGRGGNGAVSFRHEKYIDKGGPDGGDGGSGGDVIFLAVTDVNTLAQFRYQPLLKAEPGQPGSKQRKHGKNGANLEVKVPIGTIVRHGSKLLADFTIKDQRQIIARGGTGGFGNAHFKSSVRQAPKVAELGEPGEELSLKLELKLLADVGLVGLPNAGKSTFLSVVTSATPEIADYPFTTLNPNLGVADIDSESLLIADIPGLIEGAAVGKGLGDQFLRHVDRTAVLLHLIDSYTQDPAADLKVINQELTAYNPALLKRPQVIVLTKTDGQTRTVINKKLAQLKKVAPKNTQVLSISALEGTGLKPVLRQALKLVKAAAKKSAKSSPKADLPVIELNDQAKALAWRVKKAGDKFVITGTRIEKFAAQTDFNNPHGVSRLRDIMQKMGIVHELKRQGATENSLIVIGSDKAKTIKL